MDALDENFLFSTDRGTDPLVFLEEEATATTDLSNVCSLSALAITRQWSSPFPKKEGFCSAAKGGRSAIQG